ncbi:S8 family peptidase [Ruegeria atlantica]|uniref:S8 family peptidase n=1 Tax=Ruegeria atlantica TaxID=81569 RepID=UPI00148155B7|nr:S8 family serine peptidase [Ruegeria atlantica]
MFKLVVATAISTCVTANLVSAQVNTNKENTSLPSISTQNTIRQLTPKESVTVDGQKTEIQHSDIRDQNLLQYSVTADQIPDQIQKGLNLSDDQQVEIPFAAPNTVLLQFETDVSDADVEAFLEERQLEVVRTFPKIGAIQATGDLSEYFQPDLNDNSANDALIRGMVTAIEDFQADPRIRSATPDLVLRDQSGDPPAEIQITNLLTPSDIVLSDPAASMETIDWGITDIQADQLWTLPGANDGVLLGVMDVGFTRHEDLVFLGFLPETAVDDHGNHVAAIGCGQHGNGVGIKGVLPNCFVRARSGDVFFNSVEGGQVLNFMVLFSQILATLETFVDTQDDVHTFNVSLGYNWRSNFGINPDLPESAQWRTLVASQGTFLVPLLELAQQNNRVIFSAAGNDSFDLATPIEAKFASPFNWAAVTAREQGLANNGVIVEAHDQNGDRAAFSNTGGHISCPGVNIFSAVAHDPNGSISHNAYGTMSGTSMASPYCASGQLLFSLVRPGYSGIEAIDCMVQSSTNSSSGVPMLRLLDALNACPARP